jgi:heme/copper-type cytochrome/quinol oxidase subunit 1
MSGLCFIGGVGCLVIALQVRRSAPAFWSFVLLAFVLFVAGMGLLMSELFRVR